MLHTSNEYPEEGVMVIGHYGEETKEVCMTYNGCWCTNKGGVLYAANAPDLWEYYPRDDSFVARILRILRQSNRFEWVDMEKDRPKKEGHYLCAIISKEQVGDSETLPCVDDIPMIETLLWNPDIQENEFTEKEGWWERYCDGHNFQVIAWAEHPYLSTDLDKVRFGSK